MLRSTRLYFALVLCFAFSSSHAQPDTEFTKGMVTYLKLHSGMVTNFTASPDLFVGGIQVAPQITVVPYVLRLGISGGAFFSNNKIGGILGPTASVKLKTFNANFGGASVGSIGNLHLRLDHLWGTAKQRLIGGGLIIDAGNIITLGLTGHRDYRLNAWWFQTEAGIRISKKKKNPVI